MIADDALHNDLHVEHRPGSGLPWLLLHGSALDGRSYHRLADQLAGWDMYIPDLRGHGRNDGRLSYRWNDHLDDLLRLIHRIGAPCGIIGISMGGMLATELAIRRPEAVRSLCLLGASADGETPATRERAAAFVTGIRGNGLVPLLPAISSLFLGPAAGMDTALACDLAEQLTTTGDEGACHCIAAMQQRHDIRNRLGDISAPVLCLWGAQDAVIAPDRCLDTARRIPGATWQEIPDLGHLIADLQPAVVAGHIRRWAGDGR